METQLQRHGLSVELEAHQIFILSEVMLWGSLESKVGFRAAVSSCSGVQVHTWGPPLVPHPVGEGAAFWP